MKKNLGPHPDYSNKGNYEIAKILLRAQIEDPQLGTFQCNITTSTKHTDEFLLGRQNCMNDLCVMWIGNNVLSVDGKKRIPFIFFARYLHTIHTFSKPVTLVNPKRDLLFPDNWNIYPHVNIYS